MSRADSLTTETTQYSSHLLHLVVMAKVLVGMGLFLVLVLAGSAIPALDIMAQNNNHAQASGIAERFPMIWALLIVVPTAGAAIFGWFAINLHRR